MKKRLQSIAIILLTVILLGLVLYKVGLRELFDTLKQADPVFIFLAFCASIFQVWIGVVKWHVLLKSRGFQVPFLYLFKLYLVGAFFNNFLPSNVGGDVVRVYELGKRIGDGTKALASVFVERFTGFIVLIVVSCLAFLTNLTLVEDAALTLAMLASVVALLGILWVVLDARLLRLVGRWIKIGIVQKIVAKFQKFQAALYEYGDDRSTLVQAFWLSLVFYIGAIVYVFVAARAFHTSVDLLDIAIITPIILVVSMMPLTFNGIGVQEWAYVLLFTWVGLPASVGLSTIILIRAATLISALAGGLMYPGIRSGDAKNFTAEPVTMSGS